jgi:hypothetical protein
LPPDHFDLALTFGALGRVLHDTGRSAEAEPMLRRALGIQQRILEPTHPDLAKTKDAYATVLRALGRNAEAAALEAAAAAPGPSAADAP